MMWSIGNVWTGMVEWKNGSLLPWPDWLWGRSAFPSIQSRTPSHRRIRQCEWRTMGKALTDPHHTSTETGIVTIALIWNGYCFARNHLNGKWFMLNWWCELIQHGDDMLNFESFQAIRIPWHVLQRTNSFEPFDWEIFARNQLARFGSTSTVSITANTSFAQSWEHCAKASISGIQANRIKYCWICEFIHFQVKFLSHSLVGFLI